MRFLGLALAASALSLGACATTDTTMAGNVTPEDRAAYVAQAGASDLYEIQSSQIALQKAQRPEVREFAQTMITHHTRTTATLNTAAQASGLTPPAPTLNPMQQDMIAQLQAAPAAGFDQLYLSQQVPAHEMALALHRTYAANGDAPALRGAATAAVPIVQQHLLRARELD